MVKDKDISEILDILEQSYPDAECALHHQNVFQLIVAVALSAQTTDKSVNQVTPALFERYPDAETLADADVEEVSEYIKRIGMYRTKAKNIVAMAQKLCADFGGQVPDNYDDLISLPGVGRKTANVVLSVGFGRQRIAVDTHVFRVSNRLGLAKGKTPLAVETGLNKVIKEDLRGDFHHYLILYGREVCSARKPLCGSCKISDCCEYYNENIKKK